MLQLTFRNKVNVAWQKQKRDQFNNEGAPNANLSLKHAEIRKVSYHFAKQIILKYEWLGTMVTSNHHYGIFFDEYCAGVCCYKVGDAGAGSNVQKEWRLTRYELAYLARGANVHWSPTGANSKLVSVSLRLLSKEAGVKLAIAYSDPNAGEIGTIYQACNWTCVGQSSPTTQWVAPNGRIYDMKHPSDLRRAQGNRFPRIKYVAELRRLGWYEQKSNPKYRYVYVLDKKDSVLEQLVKSKQIDYPKRAGN